MKLSRVICILALIAALSTIGFAQEVKRTAKVIKVKGRVTLKLKVREAWVPLRAGVLLNEGDIVKTESNSWALIDLNEAEGETAVVEIKGKTQVTLAELTTDKKKGTQSTLLDVLMGKILIKAKKLRSKESKLKIKTPTSVIGVKGTTFSVDVEALE